MLKKNLLNLFLLISVILLAYFVTQIEPENRLLDRLTTVSPDSIRTITMQHNAQRSVLFRHDTHDSTYWQFTQPINIDSNLFRISSLLKLLNAPIHAKYTFDEVSLETTGLKNSVTQITFDQHEIKFGGVNPLNGLRFISYDNHAYLIEDVYTPLISSNFTTLVALELLPRNSKIKKLVLLDQSIEKDEKGLWKSDKELTADTIINSVQQWEKHQAFAVHEYFKRESLGQVQIYLEGNKQAITFKITDTDPWLILARPELNIEYHLDLEIYNTLINPIEPDDERPPI